MRGGEGGGGGEEEVKTSHDYETMESARMSVLRERERERKRERERVCV